MDYASDPPALGTNDLGHAGVVDDRWLKLTSAMPPVRSMSNVLTWFLTVTEFVAGAIARVAQRKDCRTHEGKHGLVSRQ